MNTFLSIISILILLTACSDTRQKKAAKAGIKYTCSMHPQVMKDEPGKCPICHMDLIPVQTAKADTVSRQTMTMDSTNSKSMDTATMIMSNEIELSDEQIKLADIQVDTLQQSSLAGSTPLAGTIAFNEKNIETISSRVKGRIERLFYKNVGDFIPKGAKVYELYSEELNSEKQEYILLLQRSRTAGSNVINFSQLLEAARHKLQLWGMKPAQIRALEQTGKAPYITTFFSPASGYIKQLNVIQGDYVMEGSSMIRIANTSSVWVETQVYTSQLSQINRNGTVTVQIPQLDNKKLTGKIEFASPEINTQTRINLLRVSIPNPSGQLKPGMVAYIYLNNGEGSTMTLPADAVIRNRNTSYVWVKTANRKFGMKAVKTGIEGDGQVEIKSGLKKDDVVVVSGVYLLNSEYLLRNGGNSMEGMKM